MYVYVFVCARVCFEGFGFRIFFNLVCRYLLYFCLTVACSLSCVFDHAGLGFAQRARDSQGS
jgi:hypothetical protein